MTQPLPPGKQLAALALDLEKAANLHGLLRILTFTSFALPSDMDQTKRDVLVKYLTETYPDIAFTYLAPSREIIHFRLK